MVVLPIKNVEELPQRVRHNLPESAQHVYMRAYNRAYEAGYDPMRHPDSPRFRAHCHKAAWDDVKSQFHHDTEHHTWIARMEGEPKDEDLPPMAAGDPMPKGTHV